MRNTFRDEKEKDKKVGVGNMVDGLVDGFAIFKNYHTDQNHCDNRDDGADRQFGLFGLFGV